MSITEKENSERPDIQFPNTGELEEELKRTRRSAGRKNDLEGNVIHPVCGGGGSHPGGNPVSAGVKD